MSSVLFLLLWLFSFLSQSFFPYFSLTLPPLHYELYTVCCSAVERAPFPHRWLFWGAGKLDAIVLLFLFLLGMVGADVVENYTRRPNRSFLSKALHMHLSELNTYELCTGVGDNSTVTGADGEGDGWETDSDTQVWMHQTGTRTGMHIHNRSKKKNYNRHTHAPARTPPLKANAIKGRITAKSIRRHLCQIKWSKSIMKRKDEMEWKRGGRLWFTWTQRLLLSTLLEPRPIMAAGQSYFL